jgi:hypothetical protein
VRPTPSAPEAFSTAHPRDRHPLFPCTLRTLPASDVGHANWHPHRNRYRRHQKLGLDGGTGKAEFSSSKVKFRVKSCFWRARVTPRAMGGGHRTDRRGEGLPPRPHSAAPSGLPPPFRWSFCFLSSSCSAWTAPRFPGCTVKLSAISRRRPSLKPPPKVSPENDPPRFHKGRW